MTSKQWTGVSLALAVLLSALTIFGGRYRVAGVLFLPLGLWLTLRREPEPNRIRPWIKVLGWILVRFSIVVLVASVIAIVAGR